MPAHPPHETCACPREKRSALLGLMRVPATERLLVVVPVVLLGFFAAGISVWTCPLVGATGCRCPGCGLTRAFGALGRGDFAASWALNPFALAFGLGWVVLALHMLLRGSRRLGFERAVASVEARVPVSSVLLMTFVIFGTLRFVSDVWGAVGLS